jgi:cobalt-zinc-cadmium efflux system membrane fusion protein
MEARVPGTPLPARPNAAPPRRAAAALAWLGRVGPTLLVVGVVGGLAVWGHHSGWKVPSFSALIGGTQAEDKDWCEEHNVPESICVECRPDLLARRKAAFCKKHGVPECPLDYPELAEVKGRPQLPRYDTKAALDLLDRPDNNCNCKLHERRLQFASAAAADKAGVQVDVVDERPMEEFIAASAEVSYDQTRVARLSSRVPGTVWRVDKLVGDPVREGEVLALVDAAEVGKAKAEFLQAVAHFRLKDTTAARLQSLERSGAVPERSVREAETALSEARIRLRAAQQALVNLGLPIGADEVLGMAEDRLVVRVQFLGLPGALAERLDPLRTTANLLPVKAPLNGVVVAREVVAGEVVDPAKALFTVADPAQVWLTLNVRQEDAKHLKRGLPVRFRPDGGAGEAAGKLSWVSTAVDEKTRTVKVRATLPNPDGRLRANTFGPGRILLRQEPYAVVVPTEAVQWEGDCFVLFVRDRDYLDEGAPKVFHVRKVRPGARDERYTEILAGVLPGEVVAVKGSGVLHAQLLKAKLGEG